VAFRPSLWDFADGVAVNRWSYDAGCHPAPLDDSRPGPRRRDPACRGGFRNPRPGPKADALDSHSRAPSTAQVPPDLGAPIQSLARRGTAVDDAADPLLLVARGNQRGWSCSTHGVRTVHPRSLSTLGLEEWVPAFLERATTLGTPWTDMLAARLVELA